MGPPESERNTQFYEVLSLWVHLRAIWVHQAQSLCKRDALTTAPSAQLLSSVQPSHRHSKLAPPRFIAGPSKLEQLDWGPKHARPFRDLSEQPYRGILET